MLKCGYLRSGVPRTILSILHWSGGRMTDGRGTMGTVNDRTNVGGGQGTETEGVVDRE